MKTEVEAIIDELGLVPHPEGGYYRETYRCVTMVDLPREKRNVSTSIYYLLENADMSHLHRVGHDELWYYHQGTEIELITIEERVAVSRILGNDLSCGQRPQLVVPAHTWFAARLVKPKGYALVSCSVSPGFDFRDFELATTVTLLEQGLEEMRDLIRSPF